ncbi:response regulator transcription factor [Sedimenticola hydrogenitrophicus]|uniref:response regulator transcription factor n=1 Tax=Sedimenticola hydrogenitrophicus TaxID=2967975 RepID=UPI0021A3CB1D|nr:response regulator [Sedimenticola hydrogenitrophicus]
MPTEPEMVHIIDDDDSIRSSLTWLLEAVDIPATSYDSAEAFLPALKPDSIGVLILDVRMPGMSGMQLLERMVQQGSTLQIIILTGHGDVPMAVRAMSNGAFYFIQKPVNGPQLVEKVREAMLKSRIAYSQKIRLDDVRGRVERLTPREREVMELIVSGHANKVIAAELGVVERTVEVHRHRVMEKMEAASVADLVIMQQIIKQEVD